MQASNSNKSKVFFGVALTGGNTASFFELDYNIVGGKAYDVLSA